MLNSSGLVMLCYSFFAGFTYWLMRAGWHNLGTILTIALLVVSVYFLGWWALLTFLFGLIYAARMYVRAIRAGKNPFGNPWKDDSNEI